MRCYTYIRATDCTEDKGATSNPPLSGENPPSQGEKRRGGGKRPRDKKTILTSPTASTDFRSYFADIYLYREEPMVEAPPPPIKKKAVLEKIMG